MGVDLYKRGGCAVSPATARVATYTVDVQGAAHGGMAMGPGLTTSGRTSSVQLPGCWHWVTHVSLCRPEGSFVESHTTKVPTTLGSATIHPSLKPRWPCGMVKIGPKLQVP